MREPSEFHIGYVRDSQMYMFYMQMRLCVARTRCPPDRLGGALRVPNRCGRQGPRTVCSNISASVITLDFRLVRYNG